MKCADINIRDPFVLYEDGTYYMYGTRAIRFGSKTGGFDVYTSTDLEHWSEPHECFNSVEHGLDLQVNWAPEVHKYKGAYYMFATFSRGEEGAFLKGTYALRSDSPMGPFVPHSKKQLTPDDWEALDGTLHVDEDGKPYLVFCHEHMQILDGTICCVPLSDDLTETVGEPVVLFAASECEFADPWRPGRWVTDGPFMVHSKNGNLFMLWSSFIKGKYAELLVRFNDNEPSKNLTHLPPLVDNDGGHGMIFSDGKKSYLTYHTPNKKGAERPFFVEVEIGEDFIRLK